MFTGATQVDPGYARAYAGIADCSSFLYMYWDGSEANLKQADAASRKALELDPESAEAHAARGLAVSLRKHYEESDREFETAIRLNPKLFEAYYFYARACFVQAKLTEAAQLFEQASRIRPEDYQAPNLLGLSYDGLGRKAEAEAAYRRCLQVLEKHLALHPDDARGLYMGAQALSQLGERERSLDWANRALALNPDDPAVLYNVACVYAPQGELELAIDCVEKSLKVGFGYREWIRSDAFLASLHNHPRVQALLKSLDT
jgi:tetratricopeptide (TPR) repeat protein